MNNLALVKETWEDVTVRERVHLNGVQYIFRFKNDYGASVIQNDMSYGHKDNLWELGVIKFYGDDSNDWHLDYDTPITDDVLGFLTEERVVELLRQIRDL